MKKIPLTDCVSLRYHQENQPYTLDNQRGMSLQQYLSSVVNPHSQNAQK